jgi:hypothetical protein
MPADMIRYWMTVALTLLSACGGTEDSPSQSISPPPPAPVAITPLGSWNVVASGIEFSCTQATMTLVKSDTIFPPTTLGQPFGKIGLSGSAAGCTTLSPLAIAPMPTVRGSFYVNQVTLYLFHQGDPTISSGAQTIWLGTQSDPNHMSGNVYSGDAFFGNPLGTWSASK